MKLNIRYGLFETNSSSTHSLIICTTEEYDKLYKNELYLYYDFGWKLITAAEIDNIIGPDYANWRLLEADEQYEILADHDIFSYDNWVERYNDCLENFEQHYTTPKGEEIVAFGAYGNDY